MTGGMDRRGYTEPVSVEDGSPSRPRSSTAAYRRWCSGIPLRGGQRRGLPWATVQCRARDQPKGRREAPCVRSLQARDRAVLLNAVVKRAMCAGNVEQPCRIASSRGKMRRRRGKDVEEDYVDVFDLPEGTRLPQIRAAAAERWIRIPRRQLRVGQCAWLTGVILAEAKVVRHQRGRCSPLWLSQSAGKIIPEASRAAWRGRRCHLAVLGEFGGGGGFRVLIEGEPRRTRERFTFSSHGAFDCLLFAISVARSGHQGSSPVAVRPGTEPPHARLWFKACMITRLCSVTLARWLAGRFASCCPPPTAHQMYVLVHRPNPA